MIKLLETARTYKVQYHGREAIVKGIFAHDKEDLTYEVRLEGTATEPENSDEIIAQIKEFEKLEMQFRNCVPVAHS